MQGTGAWEPQESASDYHASPQFGSTDVSRGPTSGSAPVSVGNAWRRPVLRYTLRVKKQDVYGACEEKDVRLPARHVTAER
jgi:hypothetical protein